MGAFSTKMRGVALDLIDRFGRDVAWTHVVSRAYSPATSQVSEVTADYTVRAVVGSPNERGYIPGDVSQVGGVELTVAAQGLAFTPEAGDRVAFGGQSYTVTGVDAIAVQDELAGYTVAVRR